jgi:hypothetical protein
MPPNLAQAAFLPEDTAQDKLPPFREGEAPAEPRPPRRFSAQQELRPPGGLI